MYELQDLIYHPTAKLSFENSRSEDFSSTYDERNKSILKATVSWPIYSGGKNRASLSKNRNLKNKKKLLLNNALKTNECECCKCVVNFTIIKKFIEFS